MEEEIKTEDVQENSPILETKVQEAITNKIQMDDYFAPVKTQLDETQKIRELLKDKLIEVIEATTFKINPDEKAIQTQAKIGIIHKASELLNDMDNQTFTFDKLKLSKKDTDINANQNKLVAEFLLKFNPSVQVSANPTNIDSADEEIEKIMTAQNLEILPGEVS